MHAINYHSNILTLIFSITWLKFGVVLLKLFHLLSRIIAEETGVFLFFKLVGAFLDGLIRVGNAQSLQLSRLSVNNWIVHLSWYLSVVFGFAFFYLFLKGLNFSVFLLDRPEYGCTNDL